MKKILLAILVLTFSINAYTLADPCTNIQTIHCDSIYTFSVSGLGDPNYPIGMNGQGCITSTSQGGSERVYQFVVPTSGLYQFNVINGQNSTNYYTSYYFKSASGGCNNTGWTCIGRAYDTNPLAGYNWTAGDTILILANAENVNTTTQTFKITCAANVCSNVQSIYCDTVYTFSVYGHGDQNWPIGMNGQGCITSTSQGGSERVYQFVVPTTGLYQFNVINGQNSTNYYTSYYFKSASGGCNNTGWTCIGRAYDTNPLAGYNWTAGDTILILANAENVNTTTQTFKITCAANVCSNVQSIYCDTVYTFSVYGHGDQNWPIGMNGQGCITSTSQGGSERVYQFVVPTTGLYQFNVINGQNSTNYYTSYYFKSASGGCNNTGWTCIGRAYDTNPLAGYNWTAGDTILILANAENVNTTTQTFKITCAANVCSNVQSIYCDTVYTFSVYGHGDQNWPIGMNGQGCITSTSQGGSERVYQFVVPTTGLYQFNVINGQNSTNYYTSYYFKSASGGCNNTGWTCIGRAYDTNPLAGYNWTAGDTILILANAENVNTTTQTFKITCAANVCSNVQSIYCDTVYTFSVYGHGDQNWPIGMNGQGCITSTSQGGSERVYQFVVPTTGLYQFNVINGQNSTNYYTSYYFKSASGGCNNTGWTCIGRAYDTNPLAGYNWTAGDTILILANAENVNTTTQTFKITCAANVCYNIIDLTYGDTAQFNVYGFGANDYPNGMNGLGCSSGTAQGGLEAVYRFVVPQTGIYYLRTVTANSRWVDYYIKDSLLACNNSDWVCINRTASGNANLGSFNWTAGDTVLFLLNAESTSSTVHSFTLCTGLPPVSDFSFIVNRNNVNFINSSIDHINSLWTFGDGNSLYSSNAMHTYANPGVYNACLKTFNPCGTDTKCDSVRVNGIQSISPSPVANIGVYTFDVTGLGFAALDTFLLTLAGQLPLYPDTIIRLTDNLFRVRYYFSNVTIGDWTLNAVMNSGDTLKLVDGLTIETATPPELHVSISGSWVLRVGFNQVYTISINNSGNTDAYFTQCFIKGLPAGTSFELFADSTINGSQISAFDTSGINWSNVHQAVITDSSTMTSYYPFMFYKIPANSSVSVGAIFHIPNNTPLHSYNDLEVTVAKPAFNSMALDTTLGQPDYRDGLDCLGAVSSLVLSTLGGDIGSCLDGITDFEQQIYQSIYEHDENDNPNTKTAIITSVDVWWGTMETFNDCATAAGQTVLTVWVPEVALAFKSTYELLDILDHYYQVKQDCFDNGIASSLWKAILHLIIGNAWDPNAKVGPGANSIAHYYNKNDAWTYNIMFENDSAAALAAQSIVLIDTLDINKFDMSTFRFKSVTIGTKTKSVNSNGLSFFTDINLVQDYGVIARISGIVDTTTGIATWIMNTIDPITNQITTDPAAGFLPPDTLTPFGQGNVTFDVKLKSTVIESDTVSNHATIIFDANPPMPTPPWVCVVDTTKPDSHVYGLASSTVTSNFDVYWSGTDNFSGIEQFSVFVSENNGPFQQWISLTSDTSAEFNGLPGNQYAFYSVAVDSAGNIEERPLFGDDSTSVLQSLQEMSDFKDVQIFPNPTKGLVNIVLPEYMEPTKLVVYDTMGSVILSKLMESKYYQLDINILPSGVYFIDISSPNGRVTKKLIKQ